MMAELGEGILGWHRSERVTDCYGTVGLTGTDQGQARASMGPMAPLLEEGRA